MTQGVQQHGLPDTGHATALEFECVQRGKPLIVLSFICHMKDLSLFDCQMASSHVLANYNIQYAIVDHSSVNGMFFTFSG